MAPNSNISIENMTTNIHPHERRTEDTLWSAITVFAITLIVFALLGLGVLLLPPLFSTQVVSNPSQEVLDVKKDPIQNNLSTVEPIVIEQPSFIWKLTPRAEYLIAARIISKKEFTDDWLADVSPLDLGLGWGDLSDTTFDSQLHWRQDSRWLFYSWSDEPPLPPAYINDHSANVHIIPATENLGVAVSLLEAGDLVLLDGLLVDAEKTEGEVVRIQYTSLTRTDAGFGGCEVIYVERLVVDGEEYR